MKFLIAAVAGLLLSTHAAGAPGSCSCSGRALCIKGDSPGRGIVAALKLPVTLGLRSGTKKQLSDELSRITGKRIVVSPSKPDESVDVDIKNAPLWDVLETFSMNGSVTIEGEDFSKLRAVRRSLAGGEKVSVCIRGAPLGQVVEELSGLSGRPLRVTQGDEKALVTLSAKAITLEGILSRLSVLTRARIGTK